MNTVPEFSSCDSFVFTKVKDHLEKHFTCAIHIEKVDNLSNDDQSCKVARLWLAGDKRLPQTVIVKYPMAGQESDERFQREKITLAFLGSLTPKLTIIPHPLYTMTDDEIIVMEDIGISHSNLATILTSAHKEMAEEALSAFAHSLAEFHAATYNRVNEYHAFVQKHGLSIEALENNPHDILASVLTSFNDLSMHLGIGITDEMKRETKEVIYSLIAENPFYVLTHGDICPDNMLYHQAMKQIIFFDFEWTRPRCALLDLVFLRMGMPTCWCAKAFPAELIESFEESYRHKAGSVMPALYNEEHFATYYSYACAFWMLRAISYLDDIIEHDALWPSGNVGPEAVWQAEQNFVRPRFIARLHTFIEIAERYNKLPHLKAMASMILNKAIKKWPRTPPLGRYPAFKSS